MKVKELIKKLKECSQEANVSIVIGDEGGDSIDTTNFEIHHKDELEYIELFVWTGEKIKCGLKKEQ